MKAGWISGESGTSDTLLRWDVGGVSKWSVTWDADVWHNIAYEIVRDFLTISSWHFVDHIYHRISPRAPLLSGTLLAATLLL